MSYKWNHLWSLGTGSLHLAYVFKIHSYHRPYQYFISFCYQMISHSIDTLYFIYPFTSWWTFGLFHFLAVTNIGVPLFVWTYIFIFLEVGLMDYMVNLCLFFQGNACLLKWLHPFYIPTSRVQRSQLLHNFTSTYYSVLFIGICVGETWYHSVVLILIYLMDRDIENIFRCFSLKRKRSTGKTSTSASLTTLRPLTAWITTNCGKVLKRWEYQTTLPGIGSWKTYMQVKKQ